MKTVRKSVWFQATKSKGSVSGLLLNPEDAAWLLVFAHGAGAGMRHPFMEAMARSLADRRIATFRYQFPYMEQNTKRPDPPRILLATVRAAIEKAANLVPDLPLIAGGKSMGGRMTSTAASGSALPGVKGLVFFGFPLHAPGSPSADRAVHLFNVSLPMLFLQGTRDSLADLSFLKPVCTKLGSHATLHIVEGADHSFRMPKRGAKSDDEAREDLAGTVAAWCGGL